MTFKISITQGPNVNGQHVGFALSQKHCDEVYVFLSAWYKQLPIPVSQRIEVITVTPQKTHGGGGMIVIKIVLSGQFTHYHQNSRAEPPLEWKNYFEEGIYNYLHGQENLIHDNNELIDCLNNRLLSTIDFEIKSYHSLLEHLNSLVALMEKQ